MQFLQRNVCAWLLAILLIGLANSHSHAQCGNISFETGNYSGWRGQVGCVTNDISMDTDCGNAHNGIDPNGGNDSFNGQHALLTPGFNGGTDPNVPAINLTSPLGGNYISRLGDYRATTIVENFARSASLEYDYQVTELNALVTLYFAIVLQDPEDHPYGERPFFNIELIDPNGNGVRCIEYVVAAQPGIPGFQRFQNFFYRDWTPVSINLSEYAGDQVKIRVVTSDCGQEAHLGYAYLDATCQEPIITAQKDVLCPGDVINLSAPPGMNSYAWTKDGGPAIIGTTENLTVTQPGIYDCRMVPFSTSSETCPFTLSREISAPAGTVNPDITVTSNQFCQGDDLVFENTSTTNGTSISSFIWTLFGSEFPNVNPLNRPASTLGNHQVSLELEDQDGCTYQTSLAFEIVEAPDPSIQPAGPFCNDDDSFPLEFTPENGVFAGNGVNNAGVFDPAAAGFENSPHVISYSVTDVCTRTVTQNIEVQERKDPTIDNVPVLCNDAPSVQLSAARTGGFWSGTGVSASGVFNPATAGPGTHTIRYEFGGLCPSADETLIQVVRRKNPDVEDPGIVCFTDEPFQLQALESGGSWSGPGVNGNTGVFNPQAAGTGTHTIIHSFGGPCPSQKILRITVVLKANADFNLPPEVCINQGLIELDPENFSGTFSGPGLAPGNKFNPNVAGVGIHNIQYIVPGNCGDTVIKSVEVHPYFDPTIQDPGIICSDAAAFNLIGVDDGGTWSGTGIVDNSAGTFDPTISGIGTHQIIHSFDGFCADRDTLNLVVERRRNASFNLPDSICEAPDTLQLWQAATELGGQWSGPGVIDSSLILNNAGTGNHRITYALAGACGNTVQKNIEVVHQPNPEIIGPRTACILEDPVPMQRFEAGGTWSGPGVSPSGIFDPEASGLGTFVITYSFDGFCPAEDTISIRVTDKLNAAIDPVSILCDDASPITLQAVDKLGQWTGVGITDSENGIFDPGVAGAGTHTITHTILGLCGDTATLDITVAPRADAQIMHNTTQYCFLSDNDTLQGNGGGVWAGPGINNQGVFSVPTLSPGIYPIEYQVNSQCPDTARLNLEVLEPISLNQSSIQDPLCYGDCNGSIFTIAQGGTNSGFSYVLDSVQNNSSGSFSSLCEGVYRIDIADALGCKYDTTIQLIEPDSLFGDFITADEKCFKENGGAEVTQIQGGTEPYTVTWSDGKTDLENYTYPEGNNYFFIVSDANGCSYTQNFNIGFIEGPRVSVSSDSVSCFGFADGSLHIDSIVGGLEPYIIDWETGSNDSTISNLTAGQYAVEITDAEDCKARDTIRVNQPTELIMAPAPLLNFCFGQSATYFPTASGGNGSAYDYFYPEYNLSQDSLFSDSSMQALVYAQDFKGCISDTTTVIFEEGLPLQVDILQDTTLCPNSAATFFVDAQGGLPNQYQFTWDDGFVGNPREINFDNSGEQQVFYVTLSDNCSTPVSDSVVIDFFPPAIAGFFLNPDPAVGCEPLEISITDTSINTTQSTFFYNGSLRTDTNIVFTAGTYDVLQRVVSPDGCIDSLFLPNAIEAYPIPQFSLNVLPGAPTELTDYYDFYAISSVPLLNYNWTFTSFEGDSLLFSNVSAPKYYEQLAPGSYLLELQASTPFGCSNFNQLIFKVIPESRLFIPNAFSPNGNGINEFFIVDGVNLEDETMKLAIYDRWGAVVFETEQPLTEYWDGIHQSEGNKVPPGVYTWRLTGTDRANLRIIKTGSVTLIR